MSDLTALDLIVPALLAVAGLLGAVAILSPRLFALTAKKGATWIDSDQCFRLLDRRLDVDEFVLRHSRIFGTLVVASVAVLSIVYAGS